MAEENILLRVGIDENQIARSEAAIIEARKEIDKLKAAQKELAKEGKQNTVEFVRNETAVKDLSVTVRENQRVLAANQKLQKSSTGSIAELRANVSRLKQEYINLSEAERENEKVGGALQKELLAQTNQLKELEEEIGVTSRNVGNYTASILEAADSTGIFGQAQKAYADAQKLATAAQKAGTAATRSFGSALIATGIGAFILLLGSLISYLTRTQEGMDKVAQITDAVGTFVSVVFDRFAKLGKQLVGSVIPIFEGLSGILTGIFTLNPDLLIAGLNRVQEAASKIESINLLQLGADAGRAAVESANLTKELQKVVRSEKALSLERAESRQQIEQLKKASDDITLSNEERADAARKALEIELNLEQKAIDLQKERVRILKAQNELRDEEELTDEEINRVIDAEIELANLKQESATKQIELQNKLNALNKEAADKRAAIAKEEDDKQAAANEKKIAEDAAAQEKINEQYAETLKERAETTNAAIRDSINEVKRQFADGLIDLETYQRELDQVEALALETRKAALQEQLDATRENALIDAETRTEIEKNLTAELQQIEDQQVSASVAARQAEIAAAKKAAEEKKQLAKDSAAFQIQAENAVLSAAKSVFGEQSAAGRIAASFQAIIDTYRGANLALATIPPPFGQIIAAATVAQGLANVAKINSTPTPKFAEGGEIGVTGPSHAGGGVDLALGGRTVANVEGGEGVFVMKKSAYSALKALSSFNQSHGGNSWLSGTHRHLADGGAVARSSVPALDRTALSETQQSFENAISQLNIVTKITDIERVQNEARLVRVSSDLS
jgi:chemotaxis protein histidine kinase CheA